MSQSNLKDINHIGNGYVLWVNLNFGDFIFANNLCGLSDDGDGKYNDDLDKLMDNSVSMIYLYWFNYGCASAYAHSLFRITQQTIVLYFLKCF